MKVISDKAMAGIRQRQLRLPFVCGGIENVGETDCDA
jgi:hypothetical protein